MAQMTDTLEGYFLNYALRGIAPTKPTSLEVSFHTATPGEAGSVTNEASLFASRLQINFNNSTARQVANTDAPSGNSLIAETCTYWALHQNTGEMLCYQEIEDTPGGTPTPMVVAIGQPVEISIGNMVWNFPDTEKIWADGVVNDFMSYMFGSTSPAARAATHVSLHTTEPNAATGLPEFGTITRAASGWNAPGPGTADRTVCTNAAQVDFTGLAAADTPINWWSAWTALTGGEFIARFDQANQTIGDGDSATAAAGALQLFVG